MAQSSSSSSSWIVVLAIVAAIAAGIATWRWTRTDPVSPNPSLSASPDATSDDEGIAKEEEAPTAPAVEGYSVDSNSKPRHKSAPEEVDTPEQHACDPIEVSGSGLQVQSELRDWNRFMQTFHDSKEMLKVWINRRPFPREFKATLLKATSELRIQRAPTHEEPDLSWRGVAVLSRDSNDRWIVRAGGGFLRFYQDQKSRARFEITRLLVQSWPLSGKPWSDLLKCLNVTDEWEGRWALSTVIAAQVTPTGCMIPGLQETAARDCMARVGWLKK